MPACRRGVAFAVVAIRVRTLDGKTVRYDVVLRDPDSEQFTRTFKVKDEATKWNAPSWLPETRAVGSTRGAAGRRSRRGPGS